MKHRGAVSSNKDDSIVIKSQRGVCLSHSLNRPWLSFSLGVNRVKAQMQICQRKNSPEKNHFLFSQKGNHLHHCCNHHSFITIILGQRHSKSKRAAGLLEWWHDIWLTSVQITKSPLITFNGHTPGSYSVSVTQLHRVQSNNTTPWNWIKTKCLEKLTKLQILQICERFGKTEFPNIDKFITITQTIHDTLREVDRARKSWRASWHTIHRNLH